MPKETFWFKHDYNARNDEKILELRAEFGAEGYGIYWMLIESMAETDYGGAKATLIGGLSHSYNVPKQKLMDLIQFATNVGLFYEEDGYIFSKRIVAHKMMRKEMSINGLRGADKRWKNSHPMATPMQNRIEEKRIEENILGKKFSKNLKEVIFSDGSKQKLGIDQLAALERNELLPKQIIKGRIY